MKAAVMLLAIGVLSCDARRAAEVGFWFEPVAFSSALLGGPVTTEDLRVIEGIARHELARAFDGMAITVTGRRDARYTVSVVQELRDQRMKRTTWIAGKAHAVRGFGGSGAVSFLYFASGALAYAPADARRADIVEGIGRGIGRGAAHEFAHQLLPSAPIHASRDRASYEFYSASRPEQYFGEMRWDVAGPLLAARYGHRSATD